MKIQQIQFNNRYNADNSRKNIACGHKSGYTYLKNISGNCCACCGKEMIPSKEIAAVWAKITRPLTTLLQEGRFNFAENIWPPIYQTLISFAKRFPNESLDSIVAESGNHFEYMTAIGASLKNDANYIKLSGPEQQRAIKGRTMDLFKISSCILKNSVDVVRNLKPLEHYMYGYRKDILNELEILSEKYPDKKLNEIVKIPEIAEKYVENTYHEAMEFAGIRDEHWNKANKIILDKYPQLEDALNDLNTQICHIYRGLIDPARVAYEMQYEYSGFLKKYGLNEIKEPVLAEVAQMPTSLFSKNSFLAYARGHYSDGDIVKYIIKPFMESAEHIYAISSGGTNAAANIIMMCRGCNNDRRSYPYIDHLSVHPEMLVNTEKQIRFYAEKILSGEIPDILEKYPIEVAKTLYNCSDGIMNYNMDYYKDALAKKKKNIANSRP